MDGFWIQRVLQSEGLESHVVDAASILTSRRRRRAKTDRIDGETLVRTLMAFKRGEPRVCSMARAPTPVAPKLAAFGVRREKAALSSGCEAHPAKSLQPEATGAGMEATKCLKPSGSGHKW